MYTHKQTLLQYRLPLTIEGSLHKPLERFNTWPHSMGPPQSSLVNTRAVMGREEQAPPNQTKYYNVNYFAYVVVDRLSLSLSSRPINHLSYIERAKLRNAHMMEQYKAVLRESRSTNNLPSDVRLSMLRRLDENVGVAKIKEQTVSSSRYIWREMCLVCVVCVLCVL